jgi:hypothetical protein
MGGAAMPVNHPIAEGAAMVNTAARHAHAPTDNAITEFLPDIARKMHVRVVLIQQIINQVANEDAANSAPEAFVVSSLFWRVETCFFGLILLFCLGCGKSGGGVGSSSAEMRAKVKRVSACFRCAGGLVSMSPQIFSIPIVRSRDVILRKRRRV